jgi:hypothetical protein
MKRFQTLILLIVLLLCCNANAGSKQPFIAKEQWSKQSDKYNYSEKFKDLQFNSKPKPKIGNFFSASWLKYVLWAIIIAAIAVVLVLLIINIHKNAGNKIVREKIRTAEVIEDIEEADLEYLLEQSLANGMYKEAIRFRYLILIRTMNRLKLIAWKKDKTNGTYVKEMFNKPGFGVFRQITIHFERIWYGELQIDANQYHTLIPVYDQMNKEIGSTMQQEDNVQKSGNQ